jgi:predicted  nucleic acid-binding Zn-ribbon protein
MNRQLELLISIQNLELMLKDAEDADNSAEMDAMGLKVDKDKIKADLESQTSEIEARERGYFNRIKKRFDNPVVAVWDGHCTGCFASVPTSFSSVTNDNKVLHCESCGRILFTP